MALKAGRVGVAPDQVDDFGKVKSDATSGYTKQEADAKFETQTAAAIALAEKQSIQLSVPIELLSGSALTVEDALNGLNNEITDINILKESAVTDIVSGAVAQENHLYKYGKVVELSVTITGITATAFSTVIGMIPEEFRPKVITDLVSSGDRHFYVTTDGKLIARQDMSNNTCLASATWITN